MENCLISIIIPIYNGSTSGIENCLKSILEQDILEKEIIIIDDCSSDNSIETINLMLKQTSVNYTIKNHDSNLGLSKSLNEGLNISKGIYKLIIQQDCALIEKSELRDSIEYMEGRNIKVLVGSPVINFNSLNDYQKIFKIRISESSNNKEKDNRIYITQLKCDLFKAEIFSIIGPFDSMHKTVGQDFVLSSKLFNNYIEMYTFENFSFRIQYEGEKTFKSICLKEFRYALAVPYISSIWRKNRFLKDSDSLQTKSKVIERFLNILFPILLLLVISTYFIYNSNLILFFIIIVLIVWIVRAFSRIIPVFWNSTKKWKIVLYSILYVFIDFFYSIGFLVGIAYLIKINFLRNSAVKP